jgi:hypothetical protein
MIGSGALPANLLDSTMKLFYKSSAIWFCLLAGLVSRSAAEDKAFVAKFSNDVEVELIGVAAHPSQGTDWWRPDGTPLGVRPYHHVSAKIFQTGDTALELCWRWHNIGDQDVQTNWMTDPHYNGAGGRATDASGKKVEGLEAIAILMSGTPKTCHVKFSITVPVSNWTTTLQTEAGNSSDMSRRDFALGRIGAAFMRPRREGKDTLVAVGYQIPNREVRLAAIDKNGQERIAELVEGGGFNDTNWSEFRFRDATSDDFVRWQLQTRIRKRETLVFQNISLDPKQTTEVQVVAHKEYSTGTLPSSPQDQKGRPEPSDEQAARLEERAQLLKSLADDHGYKLAENELLKYIADIDFEKRTRLSGVIKRSLGWPEQSLKQETLEPVVFLFEQNSSGDIRWIGDYNGVITLAQVLEYVLNLKRHQIEVDPALLMTYMPGDWVLSWSNMEATHKPTDAEIAAFEKFLNEEFDLDVEVGWKTVERPVLVASGEYSHKPSGKAMEPEIAKTVDGTFEFSGHRNEIVGTIGNYESLLQALGELLMLPIVDESTVRPTKRQLIWEFTGNEITGDDRLPPAEEARLIESLHKQLGYDFKIEPRKVKMLSIEPANE